MLQLTIQLTPEGWDEVREVFVDPKVQVLQLEHSLLSLSKWESKWCVPFLDKKSLTPEEMIDYIKCMTLTKNVNPEVYDHITGAHVDKIMEYIYAPMTATTFAKDQPGKSSHRVVTAELIYYWMLSLNIPSEYQKWHLNRLLTLIRVCNVENNPKKKMSQREIMRQNSQLNAKRRAALGSRG